ncbi:MAG: dTDP-4-dehydrorhamnose reductase [Pseudohongiellaceae bacterium]|jgi:dTDP-4-dehydrorhamnose reductase
MRVVVTGANGQLGYCLQKTAPDTVDVIATGRDVLDLSEPASLFDKLEALKPDCVINAAAYTAVDKAESESALAFTINADAVKELACYCESKSIPLIQVSTDFVFNGEQSTPYKPEDTVCPVSVYGESKLKGEIAALNNCSTAYIVRTGWVYAEHGSNFVKTMLRLGNERDQLSVVVDQVGTPTYARNLANMIWRLVDVLPEQKIFHFSDAGVASWYDFAVAIFDEAKEGGLLAHKPKLSPIPSSEYPTPAKRPVFSVLDKTLTWDVLAVEGMHWRIALKDMIQKCRSM